MTCDETTPLLMDRLQGDISPESEQRLAAHVATCPACRAEVDAMTETWDSLGTLDDEQVPHERLRARFHAGLAAYEERESDHADLVAQCGNVDVALRGQLLADEHAD